MAILAGGLAGGGAACRYGIDAVRAGMRKVIGCRHLRYGTGPADWPLVAVRRLKLGHCATPAVGLSGVWAANLEGKHHTKHPLPWNERTDMHDNGVIDATSEQDALELG